jgi:hypothetical protein
MHLSLDYQLQVRGTRLQPKHSMHARLLCYQLPQLPDQHVLPRPCVVSQASMSDMSSTLQLSKRTVSYARTWAMPLPICPAPMIPMTWGICPYSILAIPLLLQTT